MSEGTLRALVAANSFARAAGIVLALVAATLIGPAIAGPKTRAPAPRAETKVDSTFVFFGCNRIDAKDWEATRAANPSSANLPQLRQNLADAAKLAPDTLFFGGDLVMGYADDKGETLRSEVTAWIDVVKSLPRSHKTEYVALTGNHELNRKAGEAKLPGLYADAVWTELVRAAGLVPRGAVGPSPATSPEDNLADDQQALSFSFNRGSVHFVVLNTDTRVTTKDAKTGETKIAMAPVHWLDRDLAAAEKNPGIKAVIVMGHRNVVDPASGKGDAPIDPECAVPMIASLEAHRKVRAYVCAHVHAFDICKIGDTGLLQTIFGNGGSKLEAGWNPKRGRTFGFGHFKVYRDGSLGVIPYLRPEPEDYMSAAPDQVPPARPEPEILIPVRH